MDADSFFGTVIGHVVIKKKPNCLCRLCLKLMEEAKGAEWYSNACMSSIGKNMRALLVASEDGWDEVVPQSLNQSRAEGIEENNDAIEIQKLEEAGKAAVNGNDGGCKKISGFVDNETLWMLAIAPEKDICINGNEEPQNSHLWATEPASPVSRGPSRVELVGKTMVSAHIEQPGDNAVAGHNPIQERIRDDILSTGFVRDEEVRDFEVGDEELYGSEGRGVANISPGQKKSQI
ncbi:hypothetical protein V6N11_017094 [Hibiscus sabdariffa]|uniref:Uncharacterized protein n=1 Tax=Hibiscus sabdariffa TaxID=183260 RepID=A0ABR2TWZ8_9ROSI